MLLLFASVIPLAYAAKLNTTTQDILLSVPLFSDDQALGNVVLLIDTEDNLSINREQFFKISSKYINSEHLSELNAETSSSGFISTILLNKYGYQVNFDLSLLQLNIIWPARLKLSGRIGTEKYKRQLHRESLPRDVSAYINLYGGLSHNDTINDSTTSHSLALEAAASIPEFKHATIESEFRLHNEKKLSRQGTRVIVNSLGNDQRFSLGDILTNSYSYLGSSDILGINFSKNNNIYSTDQSQSAHTTGTRSFFLERSSIVRIFVNGDLKTTQRLSSGPYQLDEFPIGYGHNRILVEIEDDVGKLSRLRFNFYSDNHFLPQGESEFSLDVGAKRQLSNGEVNYTNDLLMSGFYRRGISTGATLSGFGKASELGSMLGAESLFAMSYGKLSFETAVSHLNGSKPIGSALNIGTTAFLSKTAKGRARRVSIGLGYNSKEFNQEINDLDNPVKLTSNLNYSQSLNRFWNAGFIARVNHLYDSSKETNTAISLSFNQQNLSLKTDLRLQRYSNDEDSVSLMIQMNYRFDRTQSLRFRASENDFYDLGYRVNSSRNGVGAWGMGLDLSSNQGDQQKMDVHSRYTGNRAELSASHISGLSNNEQSSSSFGSLNFASAIAYADGEWALGRPIRDSFSIFSTHTNLQDRAAYVNQDQHGNFSARIGFFGPALFSELQSYRNSSQTFEVDDLPLGYNLDSGVQSVYPTYRSGFHKTIGSDATVVVLGVLLQQNEEPAKLLAGQIQRIEASSNSPIPLFTNSAGRFSAQGLSPGNWKLTLFDKHKPLVYFLEIPDSIVGLFKVGKLQPHVTQENTVEN